MPDPGEPSDPERPTGFAHRLRHGRGPRAVLARAVGGSFTIKIVQAGTIFLSQLVLARLLGVAGFGLFMFAHTAVTLMGILGRFGAEATVVRYAAVYLAHERWGLLRGLLRHVIQAAVLACALLVLGVAAVAGPLEDERSEALLAALLVLVPLVLCYVPQSGLYALRRPVLADLPVAVVRPLLLVVLALAAWRWRGGLTPIQAIGCNAAAYAAAALVGFALLRRHLPAAARTRRPEHRRREWIATALPLMLVSSMHLVSTQTDIVMLDLLDGHAPAGIYAAATRIALLVAFLLIAVNTVIGPIVAARHSTGEHAEVQRTLTLAARAIFAFTAVGALALVLLGPVALRLFGPGFEAGYPALVVLLVGQVVNALAGSVGQVLNMTGHERLTATVITAAAIANVALNAALIPPLGTIGAAIATAATTIGWNVALLIAVRRRLGYDTTVLGRPPRRGDQPTVGDGAVR